MKFLKKHFTAIFFILLLLLGFAVRLYRFDNPVADWHSWRQADTSAVSRNFIKYGFDLLHPRMNNISNVQSGLENPQGYFFVEFPLYNATQAGLYKLFGYFTLEEWGRLITITTSLLGAVFLFLLVRKRAGIRTAFLVFIFSLFIPFNIYYGRTILSDTSMVAMMLGGIWAFDCWVEGVSNSKFQISNFKWLGISLIFVATALLLKPYALFYALPLLVLCWNKFGIKMFARIELWLFAILAVAPLALWRHYILSYPEGIPVSNWLFNGNGIRFRPAFFRWIFYERLTKLISGFFNAVFILVGVFGMWEEKNKKNAIFLLSFVVSAVVYVCVIATGNVQHDYYQIVIMPAIALLMGYGAVWVIQRIGSRLRSNMLAYGIVGCVMLAGFYVGWQQVRDYFNINNPAIVEAGQAVDKLTPPNAKVLAPLDGDSSFLYQTNRQGWASFEHDLPTLIKLGANYLVLVHPTPQDVALDKQYAIVKLTPDYVIFNLNKKP